MSKKQTKGNLRINLWPSRAWTPDDLNELIKTFKGFGPVTGKRTSEGRGGGLQTTLEFITLVMLTGFLEKIGAEIYESLRVRIKKFLNAKSNKARNSELGDSLSIFGPGLSSGSIIDYTCEYYREADLNTFLMTVGNLHSLLIDPSRNGLDTLPKGVIDDTSAYLSTKGGLQRYAQMRVDWFLQGRKVPKDFPSPPYWMLDTALENNGQWHHYVAVIPARVSSKAASSRKQINWKEYKP